MNTKVRISLAVILGAGIAVFVWYQIAMLHPDFHRFGITSLVPPTVASLLGGFIVATIAPYHKVGLSAFVGFIVSAPMLFYLLHNGFSHHGRNPFIWYWPFYVMPCFCFGGYLGGSAWRHA